jgi:hypothetical protein
VRCANSPIEEPHGGDACCPPGADANSDADCGVLCGNGVQEPGETCDDGADNGTIGRCNVECDGGVPTFAQIYSEILAARCGPCHLTQARGALDLSTVAVAEQALIGAPAVGCQGAILIVPGSPDASLLIMKADPALGVPATCSNSNPGSHSLAPAELARLRAFVAALPP